MPTNSDFASHHQATLGGPWLILTGTWVKATDSDGLGLTVQAQADGVVSGVALNVPLLRPVTTRH